MQDQADQVLAASVTFDADEASMPAAVACGTFLTI
jgi:hypothetical protein